MRKLKAEDYTCRACFQRVKDCVCTFASTKDMQAEIARLKAVLEGIVYDYDVCQNVPAARRDRVYYEAAKEALAINPIGDKQ